MVSPFSDAGIEMSNNAEISGGEMWRMVVWCLVIDDDGLPHAMELLSREESASVTAGVIVWSKVESPRRVESMLDIDWCVLSMTMGVLRRDDSWLLIGWAGVAGPRSMMTVVLRRDESATPRWGDPLGWGDSLAGVEDPRGWEEAAEGDGDVESWDVLTWFTYLLTGLIQTLLHQPNTSKYQILQIQLKNAMMQHI